MKLTTTKIAELAGVSRGAVDKTIHNRPGVREDVRRRILQVIEETGYIPLAERKKERLKVEDKTVAVILPRLSNPYFAVLKRYMDEIVMFMPALHLEYYPCDTTNVQELLSILELLEQKPIDGYLFRGVRSGQVRDKLNQQNRPVIFFDSVVSGAKQLCFIGEDCVKSGRIAASLLAKSINYRGEIAVISGSIDIPSHQQRLNGFYDVMREEYPDIRIVRQFYTQEQPAVAYRQTCRLLEDFPHLAGVCNLAGCSGEIGQAILEQRAKQTISLVCFGTAGDVAALIRKKVVTFSISLQPREQARILLETMYAYLTKGKQPESVFLHTPIGIAFDENLDSLTRDFGE